MNCIASTGLRARTGIPGTPTAEGRPWRLRWLVGDAQERVRSDQELHQEVES
jgi:hypothetical protein